MAAMAAMAAVAATSQPGVASMTALTACGASSQAQAQTQTRSPSAAAGATALESANRFRPSATTTSAVPASATEPSQTTGVWVLNLGTTWGMVATSRRGCSGARIRTAASAWNTAPASSCPRIPLAANAGRCLPRARQPLAASVWTPKSVMRERPSLQPAARVPWPTG